MQYQNGKIVYSPSDLITYMESPYASLMDRKRLDDPAVAACLDPDDPLMATLQKKGFVHEDAHTAALIEAGHEVLEVKRASAPIAQAETIAAMRAGQEVIVQGHLAHGAFAGLADFLVKVPGASALGDWHYEVKDTKLARSVREKFVIQLCAYAEMLEAIQGRLPTHIHVVLGTNETVTLRTEDYYAYSQALKSSFLADMASFDANSEPDPALYDNHGRYSTHAATILKARDHLSEVANITRNQIRRLAAAGIDTVQKLADTHLDRVAKIGEETFTRLKAQAALQIASRGKDVPEYQVLTPSDGAKIGLALLPPHSPLDVFFDIEGYPLMEGGLEYLWGCSYFDDAGKRVFRDFWAHDREQERTTFEAFIDWVMERWRADPTMHVYHYAPYEITAIRKLMGRFATREEEVDTLLRNEVFVDMYKVVRHGLLVGEPRYSIKNIEHIYRGKRATDVASGGDSVIVYNQWREMSDGADWQTSEILKSIRDYNIDDCDSTEELVRWLRIEQAKAGIHWAGGAAQADEEPDDDPENWRELQKRKQAEHYDERAAFAEKLIARAAEADDPATATALETLGHVLDFHRREDKPVLWRLFDRHGLTELDLHDDMDCLVGLTRTKTPEEKAGPRSKQMIREYAFNPDQPYRNQAKAFYVAGEDWMSTDLVSIDVEAGLIRLKSKHQLPDRMSLLPNERIKQTVIIKALEDVVIRLGQHKTLPDCAITDFLMRRPPRFRDRAGGPVILGEGEFLDEVIAAVEALDGSCLVIQGPPGAGKSYTGARVIGQLLRAGKRVGIASNSHKAVLNLLTGAAKHAREAGVQARFVKIGGNPDDKLLEGFDEVERIKSGSEAGALHKMSAVCVGGTAFAFCSAMGVHGDEKEPTFDYLFVDEAGQVAIANLIAMSRATKNIVLMGDQMQLGQPTQGSHPGESGKSCLDYFLGDHATIPEDRGVFLPLTYRMHPDVCALVSEQVYEGRLKSAEVTRRHVIVPKGPLVKQQSGILYVPVEHEGNAQASEEEVAVIKALADELIGCPFWPKKEGGAARILSLQDILFIAPYNYQVNELKKALGDKARVGSVDKFQGQEAPVVILSMCASNANDSPRGLDFLFSKNRLNVAISRAEALAIVVGHPRLATTAVNSVEQMRLVNFYAAVVSRKLLN